MTINFPSSPSQGDTYVYQTITYTYDGEKWVGSTAGAFNNIIISGNTADVILQGNDSILTDQTFTFNDQGGKLVPYQQGDWTPIFVSDNTNNLSGVSAYSNQEGVFSRVGNSVSFNMFITTAGSWNVANGLLETDAVQIGGFPYAISTKLQLTYPSCAVAWWDLEVSGLTGNPTAYMFNRNSTPRIQIGIPSPDTSMVSGVSYGNSVWAAENGFQISGTYITDDTTWTPINGATLS